MYKEKSSRETTKLLVYNVFQELIEEKPLSQISVTEIVERSNISRQTFYRHFDDIYDLLLWIFEHNVSGCTIYDKNKDFEESCVVSFSNMKLHAKLYRQVFSNDKENVFYDRFLRSRITYARKQIGAKHLTDDISFAVELYWSGYLYMVKKWFTNGMKETPENMGRYAYQSLPAALKAFYH